MPPGAGPHRLIAGRYVLESVLDERGSGVVWRARDRALDRVVAVEELRPPPGLAVVELAGLVTRVRQDVEAVARLDHPGAARVLGLVEAAGQPFLVTELAEGTTLRELVDRHGPLPLRRTAQIGLELLAVLDAARRLGVVHGSITPGTVLVGASGATRVTGFGTPALSGAGAPPVNPGAPELASGQPAGPAADVWSVGAVMHYAVTGLLPDGEPASGAEEPLPAAAGWLAPVLAVLLAASPSTRPPVAEARALLEQALRTTQVAAASSGGAPRPTALPAAQSWAPGTALEVGGARAAGAASSATVALAGAGTPLDGVGAGLVPAAGLETPPTWVGVGGSPTGPGAPWAPAAKAGGRRIRRRSGAGLRVWLAVAAASIGLAALAFFGSVQLLGRPAETKRAPLPTLAALAAADDPVPTTSPPVTAPSTVPSSTAPAPTSTATSVPPTTTATTVAPVTLSLEAEAAGNSLGGGARVVGCDGCSGNAKVGFVGNGGTLRFNGVIAPALGPYRLTISYATREDRVATLSVNGSAGVPIPFPRSGGFDRVRRLTVLVTLRAGGNTLTFANGEASAPDFDRIRVRPA